MFRIICTLVSILLAAPVMAQTTANTHISTGATLPAVCRVGDIFYKSAAFIGVYDCAAANTWRQTGSVLGSLQVGNNSPSLTSPTAYVAGSHLFSGALGATQFFGVKLLTAFSSSNAMTATSNGGLLARVTFSGTQTATEGYAIASDANADTTALVDKLEGARLSVNRSAGNLTNGRGVGTYSTVATGTVSDWRGMECYTSAIGGGGAITTNGCLLIDAPPAGASGNRAIEIADQTLASNDSMWLRVDTSNSGWTRGWASGAWRSQVFRSTDFEAGAIGANIANVMNYEFSGGAPTNTVVALNANATSTQTADSTGTNGLVGITGNSYINSTFDPYYVSGVQGYAEVDDSGSHQAGGYVAGLDGEYGHYGSGTVARMAGLTTNGGVGSGTVTTLSDVWVGPMWDTAGTVVTRVGVDVDAITEGTTANWAFRYTNGSSQVGGLTGGGAQVDTPEAQTVGAAATVTPAGGSVRLNCTNGGGCAITVGETGVQDGQIARWVNTSANVCNFTDTPGVTELAGNFAMGQWDTLVLQYVSDRWVELSRSNN